jgi:hypothetical protein
MSSGRRHLMRKVRFARGTRPHRQARSPAPCRPVARRCTTSPACSSGRSRWGVPAQRPRPMIRTSAVSSAPMRQPPIHVIRLPPTCVRRADRRTRVSSADRGGPAAQYPRVVLTGCVLGPTRRPGFLTQQPVSLVTRWVTGPHRNTVIHRPRCACCVDGSSSGIERLTGDSTPRQNWEPTWNIYFPGAPTVRSRRRQARHDEPGDVGEARRKALRAVADRY